MLIPKDGGRGGKPQGGVGGIGGGGTPVVGAALLAVGPDPQRRHDPAFLVGMEQFDGVERSVRLAAF